MHSTNYYDLLGVDRSASLKIIKSAFRLRIKEIHPDASPQEELASERTRQVLEAYKTLANPASRAEYDRSLYSRVIPDFQDICKPATQSFDTRVLLYASLVLLILLVFCAHVIVSGRTSPYRFDVKYLDIYNPALDNYCLLTPSVMEPVEWYNIQQFSFCSNDGWTTLEAKKIIKKAKHSAEAKGNYQRVRFYKNTLANMHSAEPLRHPFKSK